MRKILFACAALLMMGQISIARAQPQASELGASSAATVAPAKEIAFTRTCARGVPVYDKAEGRVHCGAPKASGSGYVIEMAVNSDGKANCPQGFSYIGHMQKTSLGMDAPANGLHFYACAKN